MKQTFYRQALGFIRQPSATFYGHARGFIPQPIKSYFGGRPFSASLRYLACIVAIAIVGNDCFAHGSVVPGVSITIIAGSQTICPGTSVTFLATPTNGGTNPTYAWQNNGGTIAGATGPTYTTTGLTDGNTISCVMTSSDPNASPTTATSAGITMTVNAAGATLTNTTATNCIGTAVLSVNNTTASGIQWYNNGVLVYTPTATTSPGGTTITASFLFPGIVFVDVWGNIYVTDWSNNRVQKLAPGSTTGLGTTVAGIGDGNSGSGANQLARPMGIFVDASGNLYVADQYNHRIQKFPAGSTAGSNGITVAGTGTAGSAANQLNNPVSVFVDAQGNIYVSDQSNYRIQKFPAGSTAGSDGITVAGTTPSGYLNSANQLQQPSGIFVDGSGNVYVADTFNNRIQEFLAGSTAGSNGITVAGTGTQGTGANQLSFPLTVALDGSGNIYVTDGSYNRIQKFAPGSMGGDNGTTVAGNSDGSN